MLTEGGRRKKLEKQILYALVQELLNDIDTRINKWIRKVEELFGFAKTAKDRFENGTLEEKRAILSDLGSNLLLKDKKLSISIEKPLSLIEETANEVKTIHARFEPQETLRNKRTLAEIYSQSPKLLWLVEGVRTWWIEHLIFEEGIILEMNLGRDKFFLWKWAVRENFC